MLRLPLIALMGFLVWLWEVDSWLPEVYTVILGAYALAAARALATNTELSAAEIVRRSLTIAGEICVYTNTNITVLEAV